MKKIYLILTVLLFSASTYAQSVGINSDGSSPDASAMLDVKSSTKGFLAPRMASLPATGSLPDGLIVYKNDGLEADMGYYYCKNNTWIKIGDATDATQWTTSGSNIYYNSGNVGIGTTSPENKFVVAGNGWAQFHSNSAGLNPSTSNNYGVYIGSNRSGGATEGNIAYHDYLTFAEWDGTTYSETMRIDASGKVCIGTTTPHARLTIGGFGHGVLGGITMTPDNDADGGHYMTFTNANVTLTVGYIARSGDGVIYGSLSDYRLNENVVNIDINQAKSRLMSLRPVEYNYISDQNKTVISGFLAHEMADAGFANGVTGEKDAVDKDGKPIYQAIDTKFLIPEMVKVIQEQQTEIDALKKELEEIKKLIQYKK